MHVHAGFMYVCTHDSLHVRAYMHGNVCLRFVWLRVFLKRLCRLDTCTEFLYRPLSQPASSLMHLSLTTMYPAGLERLESSTETIESMPQRVVHASQTVMFCEGFPRRCSIDLFVTESGSTCFSST